MRYVIKLLTIIVLISSCATIRKDSSSKTDLQEHIDTSSQEHNYQKETITEEKGIYPVVTAADSVQTLGTMSIEDTATHHQSVETDDMSLTTTVKPKVKDGKVTGYEVNSKAVAKPKTVNIPVDRKTTTKETGTDKQQTGITETKKETANTNTRQTFRFNFAGVAAVLGAVALFLLFFYFKNRR